MAISPEQLQQAVQQTVATAAQRWQEAAAQVHQEIGTLRTQVQDAQAVPLPQEVPTSLVDTRQLGKPKSFDGGAGWKDWSVVFRSYACACSAPLGLLLERTERSAGPMLNATLTQSDASCSTQPYYMLVMLCKGTALTRGVNAGAQEGLEAWRCLVLHHEPTSLTRSAGLLQELLDFSFEGGTAAQMAQFDRDIDRYEKASETFPQNIRVGVALRMLQDGPLKQHLVLSSARLTTSVMLKAEIDNVRRAQAAASSTPQPMDLSAYGTQELGSFQKGKSRGKGKGKGKSKGKPKDNLLTTPCPICGKAGRWKKDCWCNISGGWEETNMPKDKSKGKDGEDKTSTNTQQQSNKDKKNVKCWTCNG